mmetsp:Transcript_23926/g.43910  ORF Transcript_23926/g.43910 Transcript_23926/m.43910 type:complete len:331 (-) Transcript_23926:224-1216(-)
MAAVEEEVQESACPDTQPTESAGESVPDPAPEKPVPVSVDGTAEARAAALEKLKDLIAGVSDTEVLRHLASLETSADLVSLVQKARPRVVSASIPSSKTQASQQDATSKSKNLGIVDQKSLAVGGAGAGGGLGLNAPGFGPKVQHFAGGGPRGSVTKVIEVDKELRQAWQSMIDANNPITWVFGTYTDDWKRLKLEASGADGLSGFKQSFGDALGWGGFACVAVDKRGGLECKRPKFIFAQLKPEGASAIKKAKQGPHKGVVKEAFPGAHVDIVVESLADLEEQNLIDKLQAATGAHKPNGYEFEEGVFHEADYYGLGIGKDCKGESSRN